MGMEKFVPSKPIIKFPTVEFRLIRGLLLDLCPVYAVAQTSDDFLNYEQLLRPAITDSPEIVHGSPSNLIRTSCSQHLSGSPSGPIEATHFFLAYSGAVRLLTDSTSSKNDGVQ